MDRDPYGTVKTWFAAGNQIEILNNDSEEEYKSKLDSVAGLSKLVDNQNVGSEHKYAYMELALHGLSEMEMISKSFLNNTISFSDPFKGMFDELEED